MADERHGLYLLWYIQTLVTAVAVFIPDYVLLQTLHFLSSCAYLVNGICGFSEGGGATNRLRQQ